MELAERMKAYEGVFKGSLMPKTPAIIRIDGKAFHSWTKGLDKPFDAKFYAAMATTAKELVCNIQGAVFAYGQSDEISILLKDYETYDTEAWFGGAIQKIASVSASMATAYFNHNVQALKIEDRPLAFFDSRVFSIPAHEVANYFIWRQQDFIRNSVQTCARHYLGHKACHGLNRNEMLQALRDMEEPFDWYRDLDTVYRHGYTYQRGADVVNTDIPDFKELRDFVQIHV